MTKGRDGARATARNLGWILSSKGLDGVLGLLYLGITTRALGIADFGRFSLIVGASQAIITLVAFPTWQIVIQYGVSHQIAGDEGALGRLFKTAALLDCFAAGVGAVIVALILGLFSGPLGIKPDLVGYVVFFAGVQLVTLRSTPLGILRLRDDYARAALADSMAPIVRFVGTLAAWLVSPTIAGFLTVWALAEIVTAAAFWRSIVPNGDLARLWSARIDRDVVSRENPGFLRFSFSANANVALNLSERQAPLLLVGAFVGPAAAGAFGLAFQVAQALSKLAQMLTRAAFPELVHAVRSSPTAKVNRLLIKILLASTAAASVILLLVVFLGQPLLTLVGGAEFASAYPILIWLAAASCLDLATVGFEPVLMALHRAGSALLIRILAGIVMIGATVALTPDLGAIGAAIALLVGTVVAEVLLAYITFRAVARMNQDSQ